MTPKILLLACLLCSLSSCIKFRFNDKKTLKYFAKANLKPQILRHQDIRGTIRYVEVGTHTENLILFIHGAPSSMYIFRKLLIDSTLLGQARLVAVDRAGYGYSDFGKSVTSIATQADRLAPILAKYAGFKRVIVVGASYGGSVASKLAMDYPHEIDDLMFVSASLAPKQEKIYAISYMIRRRAFKWLFPKSIQVANDEKLAHEQALNEIADTWANIRAKVHILHGDADRLIYPANVTFAQAKLTNATQVNVKWIPNMGHKISYKHPEIIKDLLLEVLKK